jgi:hypothetical protein
MRVKVGPSGAQYGAVPPPGPAWWKAEPLVGLCWAEHTSTGTSDSTGPGRTFSLCLAPSTPRILKIPPKIISAVAGPGRAGQLTSASGASVTSHPFTPTTRSPARTSPPGPRPAPSATTDTTGGPGRPGTTWGPGTRVRPRVACTPKGSAGCHLPARPGPAGDIRAATRIKGG